MGTNPLIVAFTAVYFFAFRESTKLATVWRAFYPRTGTVHEFVTKGVLAFVLLGLLPIALYAIHLQAVKAIHLDPSAPGFVLDLLWVSVTLSLCGLFPRACKNLWAVVVLWHDRRNQGRRWEWDPAGAPLPNPWYAIQVVLLLGVAPWLLMRWLLGHVHATAGWPSMDDWLPLLLAIYSSELVVFFHMARERGLVYKEKQPRWLLNWRLVATFGLIIVVPLLYGVLCLGWLRMLTKHGFSWSAWLLLISAVVFPHCCASFLFLIARLLSWSDASEVVERRLPSVYFSVLTLAGLFLLVTVVGITMLQPDITRGLIEENAASLRTFVGPIEKAVSGTR